MDLLLYIPSYNNQNKLLLYYNFILIYWKKYVRNIYLIIPIEYNKITNFYIENFLNKYKSTIIIINSDTIYSSVYNINKIIFEKLNEYTIDKLVISLTYNCPSNNECSYLDKTNDDTNSLLIFTHGNNSRYKYNNKNKITKEKNGNLIGLYLINNFKNYILNDNYKIHDSKKYNDFEEYIINIQENIEIREIKISSLNVIDYSLEKSIKLKYSLHFYQNDNFFIDEISENNKIFRRSKNDTGINIIKKEIDFYKFIAKNAALKLFFFSIFQIYENGYVLENKNNFQEIFLISTKNNISENEKIIENIFNKLHIIHNSVQQNMPKIEFLNNIKIIFYEKTIHKIKNIQFILDYFPKFKKVNNIFIDSFEKTIKKLCKNIFDYYTILEDYQYNLIHGDCIFSNILYNSINKENNNNIEIIFKNPTGYFGNKNTIGLKDYDFSKILFSIYGYNKFFIKEIKKDELIINIPELNISNHYIKKKFNKIHYIFMIINWFHVAELNKKNIYKCILSYYYALYLATLL